MKKQTLITVIIPIYNGEKYLEEAINSILCQFYENLEIIIIDDGSVDATYKIVHEFQKKYSNVDYIYQDNKGPASARNVGIEHSRGDIISFIDADDIWPDNKLACQLAYLNNNPDREVILGLTQFIQSSENSNICLANSDLEVRYFLNLGSAIFKKSVFAKVGLLDESLRYSEDIDFFNRIREESILVFKHQDIVLRYRKHSANMTRNLSINSLNVMKIMKNSLDRRRRANYGEANNLNPLLGE